MSDLTQEIVKELLDYNPDTGVLTWKFRNRSWFASDRSFKSWNTRHSQTKAGSVKGRPKSDTVYLKTAIFGKTYAVHRIIWFWLWGVWPDQVDHINGNGLDNRQSNLRNVNNQDNQRNAKIQNDNSSGTTGVYRIKSNDRYAVQIGVDNKRIHCGVFDTLEDAIAARKEAEIKYNFHPNHGRVAQ